MSHSHSTGSRLRRDVDTLLAGGKVVKSYPGTSQYSLKGVSACGLASVNVVKNVLSMEKGGCVGKVLVEQMMLEEFMQHAIQICQYWSSPSHLEVEDILDIPTISRAVKSVFTEYGALSYEAMSRLLGNLQKKGFQAKRSVAAVLTKPPEIVSVFAIHVPSDKSGTSPESTIFAVFDSHSRPGSHSQGSAITFFGTYTGAAAYLAELFAIDGSLLLGSSELEWQTQLLSQYSAHIIMASNTDPLTLHQAEMDVFQASLRTIEAKAAYNDMKTNMEAVQEKYNKERIENQRLQDELVLVRAQLNSVVIAVEAQQKPEEPPVVPSSSKGKEKEVVPDDDEIEYVEEEWSGDEGRESDQLGAPTTEVLPPSGPTTEPEPSQPSTSTAPAPVTSSVDRDAEMAAALQMEFMEEDRLLQEQFSELMSPSARPFTCGLCFVSYSEDKAAVVSKCNHAFCRPCLAKHVRQKIKDLRFPVVCPTCETQRSVADPSRGVVTRDTILKLEFTQENMKRWTELELASHSVLVQCRRCKASVNVDRGDQQAGAFVECPSRLCQNMWCRRCLQTVKPLTADAHSCDASQDPAKLARERRWRKCPSCRNLVEWNAGSDVMTCRTSECNTPLEQKNCSNSRRLKGGLRIAFLDQVRSPILTSGASNSLDLPLAASSSLPPPLHNGIMSRSHTKGSQSRREVESLLAGGKVVKSYPGTSQYTQKGVSACGLASLNVAKNVLMMEMQGCTGRQLLEQMMYEEFMKHAIQICSYWSSPAHLEVEDILSLPSLAKALVSRGTRYGSPSLKDFSKLLGKLQKISTKAERSAAAILTKPPEIFAILAIPVPADKVRRTPSTTVFVVFDSHSRPGTHSEGAAFSFFGTASGAAAYLEELLAVDETLTSPSQLDWQTELLSQFSAHLLVASESEHSMTLPEAELELFQTSIRSLELKAELDGLKASMEELQEKYSREREERMRVENELVEVRAELRKVKEAEARRESETRSFSTFSSSKGKERAMEIDEEIEYDDDDLSNGFEIFASNDHHGDRRSKSLVARPPEKHGAEVQTTTTTTTTTSPPPKSGQFNDDVALALKLQEQFLEEDRFLQAQYSQLLGTAQQTFECGICMETYLEDTVAIVSGCSHDFCRDCLSTHVRTMLEGMRFPVLCPICSTKQTRAGAYQGGVVTQQNVHTLGLSEEEYERWIEFELASHSILIECRKCKASMHVDRSDHQATPIITCPVPTCRNMWCRECQQSVESLNTEDHSCDGTKELQKLATERSWQRCPGCQTLVERTMGCSTMTCRAPGCNTVFDYGSGQRLR